MKTLIIILITTILLTAADWPQFKRTPDHHGCSLGEQVTLPANLCAWVDFGSPILASPAIVNNKAYALSSRGILARIDLATNSVDWYTTFSGVNNQSSPAVGNNKVYVGSTDGNFYVLDAAGGSVLKTVATGSPILVSPLLTSDGVYFGNFEGTFYALDLDGNVKWTFTDSKRIQYGAAAYQDQIVFADGDNNLYWLRDNTTAYELVRSRIFYGASFTSPPMIWDGNIYIGRVHVEYGIPMGLNLFDFATGEDTTVGGRSKHHTVPSVDTVTGLIYTGYDGAGLQCRGTERWSTQTYWAAHPDGIYGVTSSPAVIDSVVIFGSEQGKMHFFQKNNVQWPSNDGGVEVWSYETASKKPIQSSPAVSDGKVVFGGLDGYLYGLWGGTEVTAPVKVDSGATVQKQSLVRPGKWTLSILPNPSSGEMVRLTLSTLPKDVSLAIYDVRGTLIWRFSKKDFIGNSVQWRCVDQKGSRIASGNYIAVIRDGHGKRLKSFNMQIL